MISTVLRNGTRRLGERSVRSSSRLGLGLVGLLGLALAVSRPALGDDTAAPAAPAPAPAASTSVPAPDPAALKVAQALYDAMGGQAGFDRARALRFTFAVSVKDTVRTSRTHWWDRQTNDYRLQLTSRDGKKGLLIFDLDTKAGAAWVDGKRLAGGELQKMLERGYALFINDTYWLLMPAKLQDPGVHVTMDGQADVNNSPCDRLKVTFDHVGLTPGDTYWAYVDRRSHLMTRWGMVLQGDRAKGDTTEVQYDWLDWKPAGPLTLATRKPQVGDADKVAILFPELSVTDAFPAAVFSDSTFIQP